MAIHTLSCGPEWSFISSTVQFWVNDVKMFRVNMSNVWLSQKHSTYSVDPYIHEQQILSVFVAYITL